MDSHIHGKINARGVRGSQPSLPGIDTAGGGFRAGAAGSKRYGSGQLAPQRGMLANRLGYMKRDVAHRARKEALARRAGRNLLGGL